MALKMKFSMATMLYLSFIDYVLVSKATTHLTLTRLSALDFFVGYQDGKNPKPF